MYEDDLQLGKLKENCFQALSQTHKNVSEPQTGIERILYVCRAYEPVHIVAFFLTSESW